MNSPSHENVVALALIVAAFLLGACSRDSGQKQCRDWLGERTSVAERIDGCTRLIKSGRYSGIRLVPAYIHRGIAYEERQDYDRAIADYNEAIRLKPDSARAYYNRGNAYRHKQDYDRAIADCDEALRLNPILAEAYHSRALVYDDKKDYDHAIADFNEAIRLNPGDPRFYINRDNAYRHKQE